MVNESAYEVYFVGQDYRPISKAAESIRIKRNGKEYVIDSGLQINLKEGNQVSDKDVSRQILDIFLREIAPDGYCKNAFVVNSSQWKNKKLYDVNFGPGEDRGFFCGVVGVIKKTIEFPIVDESENIHFDVTLQIKSRLDVDEDGNIGRPFFLTSMLLRDKVKLTNNTIPSNENEIFDYLLLFWFKKQLENARIKGYYKTYRRFDRNDDRIKGTIDVARHIRLNMGQKNGCIAYSYRENTINNYLNQLIVAAYFHLVNKYYDLVVDNFDSNNDLKNTINYLSDETSFSNTDIKSIIKENLKVISHPYYTEYEELRIICLRILRDEGISIFDGESGNDTQGILFYLPELWEEFLDDRLIRKSLSEGITFKSQYKIKNFGCRQKNEKQYLYKQDTFPDYVFFDQNMRSFMILDAKCKPKWEDAAEGGSVSDVMEDYNKCIRDMVAANSHATGVIFPTNRDDQQYEMEHRISEYNSCDLFYTIPISVPVVKKNESYLDWSDNFEDKIQCEIRMVSEILKREYNRFQTESRI